MFVLKKSATFLWPVEVTFPADGGQFAKEVFDAEFKRLSQSRLNELRAKVEAGSLDDTAFAREVLAGWKGVHADGDPLPYSETTRDQLLDIPGVAGAVVLAYMEALSGRRRGN